MSICAGIGKNFLDTLYLHEKPNWTLRNSRRCVTWRSLCSSLTTFIGMVLCYRRLIKNFADIAPPLHNMTKGGKQEFSWTLSADRHLRSLKCICVPHRSSRCLTSFFTVYTDASDIGLGVVLTRDQVSRST